MLWAFVLLLGCIEAVPFLKNRLRWSNRLIHIDDNVQNYKFSRRCTLSMDSSSSKGTQMQDYTIVPIMGTYCPSSDVKIDAMYLSKPNMKVVDIKDQEKSGSVEGEKEVYERRIAKDVIPVPLLRGLFCLLPNPSLQL